MQPFISHTKTIKNRYNSYQWYEGDVSLKPLLTMGI